MTNTYPQTQQVVPGVRLHKESAQVWHLQVDSFGAALDAADERNRQHQKGIHCWQSASVDTGPGAEEFTGTRSLDHALDLARNGWPEGAAKIMAGIDGLAAGNATPAMFPAYSWDVAGEQPDVAAFCAGVPEHMGTPEPVESRVESVIRISIPASYPARVKANAVQTYGIALLSHIYAIQQTGRSVALTADGSNTACSGNRQEIISSIPILEPGAPVDLDRLAFAFHPSMLRRITFAVREIVPDLSVMRGVHGYPFPIRPERHRVPGTIYIPGPGQMRGDGRNLENAVRQIGEWLTEAMEAAA